MRAGPIRGEDPGGDRPALALAGVLAAASVSLLWLRYHSAAPDLARLGLADLTTYYYPLADRVGRRLADGELPLWNPHLCSGLPLLASLQPAVLYPPTWLAALLPTADALYYGLWLQIVAAGVAAAWAARSSGVHWIPAALAGAFYAHACVLANTAWPPAFATLTWIPWLWLCVERLAFGRRAWSFGWWAMLAVSTALALLAGFPQYLVYGCYWLGGYALAGIWDAWRAGVAFAGLARRAAWLLLAVALGAGLAGAQLVPTAELVAQSSRGDTLGVEEVHYLPGSRAVRVVKTAVDPAPKNPTFELGGGTGYLGIASVLAVVAALVGRARSARTWYLVAAGLVALLLSNGLRGPGAPLFELFQRLPGVGLFRTPERLRLVYMLCFTILATWGLDALLRPRPGSTRALRIAVLASGAGLLAIGGLDGPALAWRAGLACALAAALLWLPAEGRPRAAAGFAWLAFVLFDLVAATSPQGVLHDYPRQLSERFHARFRGTPMPEETWAELRAVPRPMRVEPRGFLPFQGAGEIGDLFRSICYEPLAPGQWRGLERVLHPRLRIRGPLASPDPRRFPVFYDVASVATIVGIRRDPFETIPNEDALPRAYWTARGVPASQLAAFQHIREGSFDFHTGVLLEDPAGGVVPELPAGPPRPLQAVEIRDFAPERIELALTGDEAGWLVLTDTWYPGWVARVDGVRVPVLRANGLYRAIRVEAGSERVVFRYEPASFRLGLALSGVCLLAIAAIAGGGALRGRRRRAEGAA